MGDEVPAPDRPAAGEELAPWNELGYDQALSRWILQAHTGLNEHTAKMVRSFAFALGDKLKEAERKYGYTDGWRTEDWEEECRRQLLLHVQKGDPLDVAAYAAFCWARKWSTAPTPPSQSAEDRALVAEAKRAASDLVAIASLIGASPATAAAQMIDRLVARLEALTTREGVKP